VTTSLLILHGLLATALLGGLTHQTAALLWPARGGDGFLDAYRSVKAARFTRVNAALYVIVFALGAAIYPAYRIGVRTWIERARLWDISGLFELKEQTLAIGLALLPFFWLVWRDPKERETRLARLVVTALLCAIVWYAFIAGHIVNNVRGLFGQ